MRFLPTAALCCISLALSHQVSANQIAGCAALPTMVRLTTFDDPAGIDRVNAINDSCVAVGVSDDSFGTLDQAAIWTGASMNMDPASEPYIYPEYVYSPYASGSGIDEALDINDQDDVLFGWAISDPAYQNLPHYAIYFMGTNTWSAPINPAVSWNHSPELTNSSGWTFEYGENWQDNVNAYLVETPEPASGLLCLLGAAALLVFGYLRARHDLARRNGRKNSVDGCAS